MSYLVCDKCGEKYELQKGESPEDFENFTCGDCGGNLKYIQNRDSYIVDKLDTINEANICPKCQIKNENHAKFCSNCGSKFEKKSTKSKILSLVKKQKKVIFGIIAVLLVIGIINIYVGSLPLSEEDYKQKRSEWRNSIELTITAIFNTLDAYGDGSIDFTQASDQMMDHFTKALDVAVQLRDAKVPAKYEHVNQLEYKAYLDVVDAATKLIDIFYTADEAKFNDAMQDLDDARSLMKQADQEYDNIT